MKGIGDIVDKEVPGLVRKLIGFLGPGVVDKCLRSYERALQSSTEVYKDYYLRTRHPWWETFKQYFELERRGKSIRKNLTPGIKLLAGDAKTITTLQQDMPLSVRKKFKRDLVDDENARAYLFELKMAWHYFRKGYYIKWYEDGGKCRPEFAVDSPDFSFDVECKRISVDASRKVRRRDFYRLLDKVFPKLAEMGLTGVIDVDLNERLSGSEKSMNALAAQLLEVIKRCKVSGEYDIPLGKVVLDIKKGVGEKVFFAEQYRALLGRKAPEAHGVILCKNKDGVPIDSIEITLKSQKADTVLRGIQNKVLGAARNQLAKDRPGLVICFLEDVHDFTELANESGLQMMSCSLLGKEELEHLVGISYCSEPRVTSLGPAESFGIRALFLETQTVSLRFRRYFNSYQRRWIEEDGLFGVGPS